MSNFYQQKSNFENIKFALLTEIGRGVIRLAPALLVLYAGIAYISSNSFANGQENVWLAIGLYLSLGTWLIYKRIVIFTFLVVCIINLLTQSTVPMGFNDITKIKDPFLISLTSVSFFIFAVGICIYIFKTIVEACLASAAKDAAIESAKPPAQRLAESKARDDEYQERQEKETQEWDEEQHRMNEEMNQRWFDDHHKK